MKKSKPLLWTRDFISICAVNVLLLFGWQMLLPTLPLFISSLGAEDYVVGIATAAATLAAVIIRPLCGLGLDRLGRKRIFYVGLVIMISATLAYGWLPYVGVIIIIRALHGFGWGISSTSSTTIATDTIPKRRFGEGIGFFTLTQSFSLALAPALGLMLISAIGFNNLVYSTAGILLFAVLLAFLVKHRPAKVTEKRKGFMLYEKGAIRPSFIQMFVSMAFGTTITFISLYGKDKGVENIGLYFTVCASTLLVLRAFIGKFIDRYGFNLVVFIGFAFFVFSMILLGNAPNLTWFLVAAVMEGAGYGALQMSLQTMAVINAPEDRLGIANATFLTGLDSGTCIGNLIAGALATAVGYSHMFMFMSMPLIIGAVFYFVIIGKAKKQRSIGAESACGN